MNILVNIVKDIKHHFLRKNAYPLVMTLSGVLGAVLFVIAAQLAIASGGLNQRSDIVSLLALSALVSVSVTMPFSLERNIRQEAAYAKTPGAYGRSAASIIMSKFITNFLLCSVAATVSVCVGALGIMFYLNKIVYSYQMAFVLFNMFGFLLLVSSVFTAICLLDIGSIAKIFFSLCFPLMIAAAVLISGYDYMRLFYLPVGLARLAESAFPVSVIAAVMVAALSMLTLKLHSPEEVRY